MKEFLRPNVTDRQSLNIINDNAKRYGVYGALTHGDDESMILGDQIQVFLDNNIQVHLAFATKGELGIPKHMSGVTPEQMAKIREEEIQNAAKHVGFSVTIFQYPDSKEQNHEKNIQEAFALDVRKKSPAYIFAVDPREFTPIFDHVGHTTVGQAARLASQTANIKYLYDSSVPVMDFRPSLLLWTTDAKGANRYRKLTNKMRNWRNNYLSTYYPSQFPRDSISEWSKYFDTITFKRNYLYGHVQLYNWIR